MVTTASLHDVWGPPSDQAFSGHTCNLPAQDLAQQRLQGCLLRGLVAEGYEGITVLHDL